MANNNGWTVDKKIPLALIVTIVLTAGGWLWSISSTYYRISQNESSISKVETDVTEIREFDIPKLRDVDNEMREKMARSDTTINSLNETMRRIDGKLDRLIEKEQPPMKYSGPR